MSSADSREERIHEVPNPSMRLICESSCITVCICPQTKSSEHVDAWPWYVIAERSAGLDGVPDKDIVTWKLTALKHIRNKPKFHCLRPASRLVALYLWLRLHTHTRMRVVNTVDKSNCIYICIYIYTLIGEDLEGEEELAGVEVSVLKPKTIAMTTDISACQVFRLCLVAISRTYISRYVDLASEVNITGKQKGLRWCQPSAIPWHHLQMQTACCETVLPIPFS